ncbi:MULTISPECIES: hypothetical protein [Streptomyces]|uniref:Uncharacterized protein n=1 Tax=Streptomyces harbinensis TaxID=1176198 RepID=A0A1I6VB46_9ACTN|nr:MULTISPECIES: hypothetical protein [Streptomyces]QKV69396.1 hypothetical protein HUT13_11810 [Streptomyces harbinensis]SFT10956.1 hypothetical protein SAMN05444716_107301 [Streptomyces harbinensis]
MSERVSIVASDGRGRQEVLDLALSSTRPPFRIEVTRRSGSSGYEGNAHFICLAKLQRDMYEEGMLLCCQGSRPDITSSSMLKASGGRQMYVFDPETRELTGELVDIFAPAPYEAVATPDEQRAAFFAFSGLVDRGWRMPR